MEPSVFGTDAARALELLGIAAFAASGAMLAIRKGFDVVGIVLLAQLTALGGGVVRDLVIGDAPPDAFERLDYLALPAAVGLLAVVAHPALDRIHRPLLAFDAAGLALFTVTGTLKALAFGLRPLPAAMLGVVTGVGGGLLRDVVAREVPVLVRPDTEIYAIPATLGALAVAFVADAGAYRPVVGVVAAAAVFALRLAALARGWRAPGAWRRGDDRREHDGEA